MVRAPPFPRERKNTHSSGRRWRAGSCRGGVRYIPLAANPTANNFACTETTTLFLFSSFLYITGAVVFSLGRPYRRSMFSNCTVDRPPAPERATRLLTRARLA